MVILISGEGICIDGRNKKERIGRKKLGGMKRKKAEAKVCRCEKVRCVVI